MSYISGHAGSGSPLQFASAAASEIPGTRVEPKYCERCGRMYMRPVDRQVHLGRDCDRCIERARLRAAQEARELHAARELGDPKKMMPAQ